MEKESYQDYYGAFGFQILPFPGLPDCSRSPNDTFSANSSSFFPFLGSAPSQFGPFSKINCLFSPFDGKCTYSINFKVCFWFVDFSEVIVIIDFLDL